MVHAGHAAPLEPTDSLNLDDSELKQATHNLDATEARNGTPSAEGIKSPGSQDLRSPLQVIAMARIGQRPDLSETRNALDLLKNFRAAVQQQMRSDLDLDQAQVILQKMAMGYMPTRNDCVAAVQSLAARMAEKTSQTRSG
jgi:hypothetical protein